MLRIEEPAHWLLVTHPDHARLAGEFARAWGNDEFVPPQPLADVLVAVARHDDAWLERDAQPFLAKNGRPAAFSSELVGTYNAFEDIQLADYLRVRGQATEAVAAENRYAAILVSMHTLNLLTEQADLARLSAEDLALHRTFVDQQRARQRALLAHVSSRGLLSPSSLLAQLDRAFRFLQACDSLSLVACVRYARPIALRHAHPQRDGASTLLDCHPLGQDTYRVYPYPFARDELSFQVPFRRVPKTVYPSEAALRAAYAEAPQEFFTAKIVRHPVDVASRDSLHATSV